MGLEPTTSLGYITRRTVAAVGWLLLAEMAVLRTAVPQLGKWLIYGTARVLTDPQEPTTASPPPAPPPRSSAATPWPCSPPPPGSCGAETGPDTSCPSAAAPRPGRRR